MIESTYACKECGIINHICIGNTPLNMNLDLTKDANQADWDYVCSECEVCGAENKLRLDLQANPPNAKGTKDE